MPRDRAATRHAREHLIRRRHETVGKGDALGFVTIEHRRIRAAVQDRGELPREVRGVADPGVHALSADRTVNVRRVTGYECMPSSKMIRDAMVHVIGREPVHVPDVDAHPSNDLLAHVVPREILVLMLELLSHGADQPRASLPFEWKDE